MTEVNEAFRDDIIAALRRVHDPELPVNLYDLGLIYDLDIRDDDTVHVRMTLTAPNCPVADQIPTWVRDAVRNVEGVADATVELVWNPPWSTDMMSEEGRIELEAMGIDPDRAKQQLTGGTTQLTRGKKPVE